MKDIAIIKLCPAFSSHVSSEILQNVQNMELLTIYWLHRNQVILCCDNVWWFDYLYADNFWFKQLLLNNESFYQLEYSSLMHAVSMAMH